MTQQSDFRPTHRHKKRGTEYQVMRQGILQTDGPLNDGENLVAYRGKDGGWYFRPVLEFDDNRFEELPEAAPSPAAPEPVAEAAEGARKVLAEIYTAHCATLPEDTKSRIRRACMAVADALTPLGRRVDAPLPNREKLVGLAAELKSDANEGKFSFAYEALNHAADRILAALGDGR